ncbi:helix-turn-helix domain-containing protein [Rhodobacter capsulatus]|uniref:helix-turn-helix domain-containing protein n=1 Tax=Rhodobacter capsulatus TaxID=1061 RepID=UPI0003D30A1D|nr:helix-turn-helix transcriptional regulator [Rhodobacter capsulatus]ETD89380.1 XRE family transcriptional regulator [Rhodobacter capsulatus YW2]
MPAPQGGQDPKAPCLQSAPLYRELRGLTLAAQIEKTGVKRVVVSGIETGLKQSSIATLRALADALGVNADDLAE